ncbi:MAG: hypothetical protein IT561_15295 [Alphaproteobacteria bacterium]|nr:hypothetical protein [Alphaproteobacteria bacterium]
MHAMRALGWLMMILGGGAMAAGLGLDALDAGAWRIGGRTVALSGSLMGALGAAMALGGTILLAAGGLSAALRRAAAEQVEAITELRRSLGREVPPLQAAPLRDPGDLRIPPDEDPMPALRIMPEGDPIAVGSRIAHRRHGMGTVTGLDDRGARITFDRGGARVVPLAELERAAPPN